MTKENKIQTLYRYWKNNAKNDPDILSELMELNDEDEIYDRFYKNLEFGTGGIRGIIGAGTNRINIYTINKASQGLSNHLKKKYVEPSVAIAYDSRIKSNLFAKEAAKVFAANGIEVKIFSELMPTPTLSFAVRELNASAGIVITASHNPSIYNGYKVYGSDGCQITLETANMILEEIESLDIFNDVLTIPYNEGVKSGTISYINKNLIDNYLNAVIDNSIFNSDVNSNEKNLSIVYTPLNGSGLKCVTTALKKCGYNNLTLVSSQSYPDGNFPTCPYPNPENYEALKDGLKLSKDTNADLLLATDPDCDRVGIAVKDGDDYHLLNGNEIGILLFDYICKRRIKANIMPENPIVIKSIVTTDMIESIAEKYKVQVVNVLTGFKFIGEQIGFLEKEKKENRYIFGFEESYGYLSGSYVRDKDGVNGCLLIAEMANYYKSKGKTLFTILHDLYEEFGWNKTTLLNFNFNGESGSNFMKVLMEDLRKNPPALLGGLELLSIEDYLNSVEHLTDGKQKPIFLPPSNVLKLKLQNNNTIVIRPSGTEPKLKVYLSVSALNSNAAENLTSALIKEVDHIINTYKS